MKTLLLITLTMFGTSIALADDSSPDKVLVTGEQANKIAELPFLDKGATGSSLFVTGVVQVKCIKRIPLEIGDSEVPAASDFKCTLLKPSF